MKKIFILLLILFGTTVFGQIKKELIETRKFIDNDEFLKAIPILNSFILKDSTSYEAYTQRGLCFRKIGNYTAAFNDLNRAIYLNSSNAEAYCVLGSTYAMTGKYDSSLVCFNTSIQLDSTDASSYSSRGALYFSFLNNNEKALADYNKAIKLDPKSFRGYYNRALIFRQSGLTMESISDLNLALKLHPKDQMIYNERGLCFQAIKKYNKAIRDYKNAIRFNSKLDPFEELQYRSLYQNIGECYESKGKSRKARKYFERATI